MIMVIMITATIKVGLRDVVIMVIITTIMGTAAMANIIDRGFEDLRI